MSSRTARTTALALTVLLTASVSLAGERWAAFRGPGTTGVSSESLPPGDGPLALELVWKRPLGSGYSGISIGGGRLVTGFSEGDRDIVAAFDRETGEEVWRHDLAPIYTGHDGSHDGPIATPAISDGRVFMGSPWGQFVALDLASGAVLWAKHMIDDLGGEPPLYGFGASPLVVGDTVVLSVCGDGESIVALDVASGATRWRSFEDPCEGSQGSPVGMEVQGRSQIVVLSQTRLVGLDPASGSQLWELPLDGEAGAMGSMTQSPLTIGEGRMLVKHEAGKALIVALAGESDALTPSVVASGRGLARSYSPPTLWGSALYGYSGRLLSAVDATSGEELWRSREPGDGFLLAIDGQLAVITKTGSLHLGAARPEGWQETARLDLFEDLAWTPPSFAEGSFYLRSLGEMARVRLVRRETAVLAAAEAPALPPALTGLAAEVAAAEDPAAVVDRFLEGRELPLVDGTQVVFLWRGGDDVAIAGDMIGMRREESMHRLEGTDLWWWSTEIDRRARMSYLFFVGDAPRTDPSHSRRATATILGPDMNWQRDESVEMSWFAMPEWPGRAAVAGEASGGGRVETIQLTMQPAAPEGGEAPEPVDLTVHVWLPPGYDESEARYPTVYLHHDRAFETGGWPETLDRVVGSSVAPLIAVFPEQAGFRGLGAIFVEQLVARIDERYRTRAERASRANVGMGWRTIAATAITFGNPDTFGLLGLQSVFLLEEQMEFVQETVGDADASTVPLKIYLEWGKWDLVSPHEQMNMRRSSKWAFDLFASKGWQPIGGEVWDSTDFSSWRNRTGVLLEALFPMDGATSSSLALWRTGE